MLGYLHELMGARVAAALMAAWVKCCVFGAVHANYAELRVHAILFDVKDHDLIFHDMRHLVSPLNLFRHTWQQWFSEHLLLIESDVYPLCLPGLPLLVNHFEQVHRVTADQKDHQIRDRHQEHHRCV